jgi:hypothetical protein
MFQASSKSAQHRRSGAGSATAVVLLGAGLACGGQARADEGTGIEALGTLGATGPAAYTAPPAVRAESNKQSDNPYLAAALGGMAGRTPVSKEPFAAQPADPRADRGATILGAAAAAGVSAADWAPIPPARLDVSAGTSGPTSQRARDALADTGPATPPVIPAAAKAPRKHAARITMASWKPVAQERLDDLRGGFDAGAGLQVSFGIERAVIINGALVVATSLTIPDVSRISAAQATQLAAALGVAAGTGAGAGAAVSSALAANPVTGTNGSGTASSGPASSSTASSSTASSSTASSSTASSSTASSSSSTGASASAAGSPGTTLSSLPATAVAAGSAVVATNGALSLIQNGPGNSAAASMLAGAPATVIQNTLSNQSIQNLLTINAGVNTLQAFRAQVASSALNNALLNAASRH